ncbi:tryptophan--tRNA ligase, mitochondrial-like [Ciona intestinalis]
MRNISSLRCLFCAYPKNKFLSKYFSNQVHRKAEQIINEKRVIFSGIQPTGIPHIGNYLGALKHWVELQNESDDIYYSIVDLHSLTIPKSRDFMRDSIFNITACLLACGVNPDTTVVYQQSSVPEHTQLSWVIGCIVPVNRLKHLPQWKEKLESSIDGGGHIGRYTYPVLQTADILLYKATHVPAGEDQAIHLVLTNEFAKSFNRMHGKFFPETQMISNPTFARIRDFRDPRVKMSKSSPSINGRIELTDTDSEIHSKIKRAVTDCTSQVTYDPENRPGVSNLIQIHCGMCNITPEEACAIACNMDTGKYKSLVADAVIDQLSPIREKYLNIRKDEVKLKMVLDHGAERARVVAKSNWESIRELLGINIAEIS